MTDLNTVLVRNDVDAFDRLRPMLPQLVKGQNVMHAVRRVEWAKILLEAGADINEVNSDGRTALFGCNDRSKCRFLLARGCDVNKLDKRGKHALATISNVAVAKIMVMYNADLRTVSNDGRNLIHQLSSSKMYDDVCAYLIEIGVDVHFTLRTEETLLHRNISARRAKMLINAGVDIHARDNLGYTALYLQTKPKTIKVFLEAGADVNAVNRSGHNVLHAAGLSREAYDVLIAHGVELNRKCTCIHKSHPFNYIKDYDLAIHLVLQGMDPISGRDFAKKAQFLLFITCCL